MSNYKLGLKSVHDPRYAQYERLVIDEKTLPVTLPASVDYSYAYPAVSNQNALGVCTAFGSRSIFEFYRGKREHVESLVSARAIFSQARSEYDPGDLQDTGLNVSDVLNVLEQFYVNESDFLSTQNESESDFPLWLELPPTAIHKTDFVVKQFVTVNPIVNDMRKALYKNGPLLIGLNWANEWFGAGSDGRLATPQSLAGGHCVNITGYNDGFVNLDGSKGAFKIMNSWGTGWADQGYCYLPYNVNGTDYFPTDIFTVKA
jgi:C1A family cysteine protease